MSERSAVQDPMLRYADEIGWEYVTPEDALQMRGGDTGLYFREVLEAQLLRLNPGIVNTERAADIIRRLNLLNPTIEGNRDALSWLQGEQSVFVPEENRERNVRLIDFEVLENNVFHVTDEWRQKGVKFPNRADVVLLINGIPVALAETKSATKRDGLAIGVDQIRRYHRETPEFFIATQVFEVTQLLDFFYGVTWSTSRKNIFNWKEVEPGNYERKVKTFFDRERFVRLLRDYIIFLTKDDELSKVILRQHQTRAVEKALERIYDPTKRRGLIWHTQGSGKTLTMITIASKLLREVRGAEKPTVLMIVDRNELEAQLFKNIASYGITTLRVAESKRDLQRILASEYRGLVVSMIHKFDDIPANMSTRDSVVVLVDEAHRSTGGNLGNYLIAALPNATYLGFTGTPVDNLSKGKGTFKVFGGEDETGYLDKYSIAESIEDGTTVRLNYALAPSDLRVDRETLEREFLSLADAEGISDKAYLRGANLQKANVRETNLQRAQLWNANFQGADLRLADLKRADLRLADLQEAKLFGTNLQEANLSGADLQGAVYEPNPGKLPDFLTLIDLQKHHLDTLVFHNSPAGLIALREAFKKAGMRTQERQLTYSIERTKRLQAWNLSWYDPRAEDPRLWLQQLAGKSESLFSYVWFELPSAYGMAPGRALWGLLGMIPIFALPYWLAIKHANRRSGIWMILPEDRLASRSGKKKAVLLRPPMTKTWRERLAGECRMLRTGLYFSLLSAFHLGWREYNVGTWIARLQPREYTLRSTGWVRTVAGLQSLLSVYLLALWVLTYFGRPFE